MNKEIRKFSKLRDKDEVAKIISGTETDIHKSDKTDEDIVQSIKHKASLDRRLGLGRVDDGLIDDKRMQALKRLEEVEREKSKDIPIDIFAEKLINPDNEDDILDLCKRNPNAVRDALKKIQEEEMEAKKKEYGKYGIPECPLFKKDECPANQYGEPKVNQIPDEAKNCPQNKEYECPYLKVGYGYGKASVKEIRESTLKDVFEMNVFSEATIMPNQNLIKGVSIISKKSKNNREYSEKALKQIADMVGEGMRVFADHKEERSIMEILGYLKNAVVENGNKVKADFTVLPKQKWIFDIATMMPFGCGFSIVARGKTYQEAGIEKVEEITELKSCDLVVNPATTKGIFESEKRKFKEEELPCEDWNTAKCPGKIDYDVCLKKEKVNCPYLGV